MKKNILTIASLITFSLSGFAQQVSCDPCCNKMPNKESEIVMTESELQSFLDMVADAKRNKMREEKRNKRHVVARPKHTETKVTDHDLELKRLNDKLDLLIMSGALSNRNNTQQLVPNQNNDDLKAQMALLEQKLSGTDAQKRSMLEELLKKYGNFRKQVFFQHDSFALNEADLKYISDVADVLKTHKELSIVLEGFASPVGSADYNKRLSMQRAEAVSNALNNVGISDDRIFPAFKGEDHSGSESHARRVDMTIVIK